MSNISHELAAALDSMQSMILNAESVLARLPMANETRMEIPCDPENERRSDRLLFDGGRLYLTGHSTRNNYRLLAELPIALRLECCKQFPAYLEMVRNRAAELPNEVLEAVDGMKRALATVDA